jgi:hypothetical protein
MVASAPKSTLPVQDYNNIPTSERYLMPNDTDDITLTSNGDTIAHELPKNNSESAANDLPRATGTSGTTQNSQTDEYGYEIIDSQATQSTSPEKHETVTGVSSKLNTGLEADNNHHEDESKLWPD